MSSSFRDDASLVRRFQAGDNEAFNEIDSRYRARLVRFLFRRSHSQELAEELAQETLTRALAALPSLRDGSYLGQWLYRIAYTKLVDYLRRNKPSNLNVISYDEKLEGVGDGQTTSDFVFTGAERRPTGIPFENGLPEEPIVRSDEHRNVWRVAKNILSVEEFQMLWMKYVDGFSDEHIALELNRRPGTVRVILSRIRKKILRRLRDVE